MKRKLPLFLAMLMMVSVLCSSMAYAAPVLSPSYEDNVETPDPGIEIEDPDVPLIEVPEVIIRVEAVLSGATSNAEVLDKELEDAIAAFEAGEAIRLTIISEGAEDASKAEVMMPGKLIREIADMEVELNVVTPLGRVLMSGEAFQSFLGGKNEEDITLVIEKQKTELGHELVKDVEAARIDGGTVTIVYVLCAGKTYYTWNRGEITLYLPIGTAEYVEGNGYDVRQVDIDHEDVESYVGLCMLDAYTEDLKIVITVENGYLGYFVVLADPVATDVGAADPSIVVSPLASKTAAANESTGIVASVQRWFDSVASQVMKLFGL